MWLGMSSLDICSNIFQSSKKLYMLILNRFSFNNNKTYNNIHFNVNVHNNIRDNIF